MKRIFSKFLLLNSIIFLPFFTQNVLACQCFGFETPYEAYKNADAVFVGKVVSIKDLLGKEIIKDDSSNWWENYREREGDTEYNLFAVQEWFKGEKKSEVTVLTGINMCERGFSSGRTTLIYAYKSESSGELRTHIFCSRIYFSDTDVYFLRELLANKPEPRIYGTVLLKDRNLATNKYQESYLENIKIIAQKGKRKFVTFTDKNGLYRFYKLPDGKYRVYPDTPKKYERDFSFSTLVEINLQKTGEPHREYYKSFGPSAYADFAFRWSNKISGRVLDAEGKQVDRASIRLLQPSEVNDEPFNKEGKIAEYVPWDNREKNLRIYDKNGNTPGKYILALEVFAPFISGQQKLRMYYPQALTPDKAEIITLGQSTQRNIDLKLPAGFVVREIEGSFLWGSGVPIEGGWVSIEKMENSDHPDNVVYESQRPENGKFKFQVFENAEYWIHGKFENEKAKPIKIKVGKTNELIKLCITLIKDYKSENCSQ